MGAAVRPVRLPNGGQQVGPQTINITNPPEWLWAIPRPLWRARKEYFVGGVDFLPLGAAGTAAANQTLPLNVTTEAHFVIRFATYTLTDTTGLIFFDRAPILVQLTDSGSGRQLESVARPLDAEFSNDGEPIRYWNIPAFINAGATLSVAVQNLEATARNLRISFSGFKIYPNASEDE